MMFETEAQEWPLRATTFEPRPERAEELGRQRPGR